jgi:hypothetical protein
MLPSSFIRRASGGGNPPGFAVSPKVGRGGLSAVRRKAILLIFFGKFSAAIWRPPFFLAIENG